MKHKKCYLIMVALLLMFGVSFVISNSLTVRVQVSSGISYAKIHFSGSYFKPFETGPIEPSQRQISYSVGMIPRGPNLINMDVVAALHNKPC